MSTPMSMDCTRTVRFGTHRCGQEGRSALHLAASMSLAKIVKLLLRPAFSDGAGRGYGGRCFLVWVRPCWGVDWVCWMVCKALVNRAVTGKGRQVLANDANGSRLHVVSCTWFCSRILWLVGELPFLFPSLPSLPGRALMPT